MKTPKTNPPPESGEAPDCHPDDPVLSVKKLKDLERESRKPDSLLSRKIDLEENFKRAHPRLSGMTRSQRSAVYDLLGRALAHYGDFPPQSQGIPQQWNSLMIGPTGCGKTSIVETLTELLGGLCVKCTHGSWIPAGAYEGHTQTLKMIINAVGRAERVVVFVDELDKFFGSQEISSWHSSVLNELWLLLDKSPVLKREHLAEVKTADSIEDLGRLFKQRTFIVAAGTWQDVFKRKPSAGFVPSSTQNTAFQEIMRRGTLPDEVRRRFHSKVIEIKYPDEADIRRIIAADDWLVERLRIQQITPDYAALCREVREIGMTALTSYKAEHILADSYRKLAARFTL
ncbi:MAG: AAA family ATPase [Verrucomicrobia bacterium]|nr:AAA family ATPase [Verrucomicrobiota bacterium]